MKTDSEGAQYRQDFALIKQWRALATRYDELAITYRAAAVLAACITWLRALGDTP